MPDPGVASGFVSSGRACGPATGIFSLGFEAAFSFFLVVSMTE
jgi:hypothetical protein